MLFIIIYINICITIVSQTNKQTKTNIMKITREYIKTTKNQVLREVLTAMESNIDSRVKTIAAYYDAQPHAIPTTEFGFECIELGLIYDLAKSVLVYTNDTDKVISFEAGTSVKGNFEMIGSIERENKTYPFRTEAIIASGAIQRAHYRYITKTTLPSAGNIELAKEIKKEISKNNKIANIQSYLNTLNNYKAESIEKVSIMESRTDADWIEFINASDSPMFEANNWSTFDSNHREMMNWNIEADYVAWIANVNADKVVRAKRNLESEKKRIIQLSSSIAKEETKLEKAQLA